MLDYLDFRYVHRPLNHESNPLQKCHSKTIANDNFYLKKKEDIGQGSIMMFSCFEILKSHTNIILVTIFNKKKCYSRFGEYERTRCKNGKIDI